MDSQVSSAPAQRKAPRHQSLRELRLSRRARKRFRRACVTVVAGGALTLMQINRNQINLEQAIASIRTAHVTRPLPDGRLCQDTVFDNKTNYVLKDATILCAVLERNRSRPQLGFTWGN
jgi:hypothetical protein